jgi:hexosaminidase
MTFARHLLLISLFWFPLILRGQPLPPIIPKPVSILRSHETDVQLRGKLQIIYDTVLHKQAVYLSEQLQRQCGLNSHVQAPGITPEPGYPSFVLRVAKASMRTNAYTLRAGGKTVEIVAADITGIVHGIQTLLQLLPLEPSDSLVIPAVIVDDYPRFPYRGMHLDVVRHIFPVDYIRKYIDYLAFHKFNTFHWHLTDDQGWRIEIESYPKLNSIGSWRDSTLIGHFRDTPARYDRTRYGGFYTRAEVRDIIEYAMVRGITIIPEIDIPGHSRATIAAYPEFSTDPSARWNVATTWGMYNRQNNVLAPSEQTLAFLRAVFQEVADLFPSPYFHLGGDECSKMWWKQSPSTQAFMRANGIANETALQTWFVEQVGAFLREKGKTVVGWHEIMEGKLDKSTVVMNWSNDAKAIEAVRKGYRVIQTPGKPFYFDHYQSRNPADSLAIHGYNPMESVYRYEPVPAALSGTADEAKILGGQGNVWTEYMASPAKVDYMVLPRMTALSESLWTPRALKNYEDFLQRVKSVMLPRYQYWGSHWFRDFEQWGADR